ncbi:hypothetical protein [Pedobacter metabolipauper]|uniref:Uncharacterized protein n=1 Tax=Pedobacter metabolipauper TaxID=425513 RepID=A0A4R6SU53_9SPHI|nr:hypothetical protein [Pedobacter metabolipauper]TDQ08473.1 hypothetical protein ATK78_2987 [Pedobacter metabolipauper]
MRKTIFLILACTLLSFGVNYYLWKAEQFRRNINNGFLRIYRIPIATQANKIDLKYTSFYIAGITNDTVFFGNSEAPTYLLKSNLELKDTVSQNIKIITREKIAWQSMKVRVEYPNYYITEGVTPINYYGKFPNLEPKRIEIGNRRFDKPIVISPTSVVFRTPDTKLKQNILMKVKFNNDSTGIKKNILMAQGDGYFSTDGALIFDEKTQKIVYLYYYRNTFSVLDTNLNLILDGHTVDTISKVKLSLHYISSLKTTKFDSPPLGVNSQGSIYNNQLFVLSKLRADNENKQMFSENFVIDVYALSNGSYNYSIYLPKLGHKKISNFKVYNNFIYAIYDTVIYKFIYVSTQLK